MVYPAWNPELRSAMKDELDEFVDQVTRTGDGKLETLLTAGYSYLNGPLYGLYGVHRRPGADAAQDGPARRAARRRVHPGGRDGPPRPPRPVARWWVAGRWSRDRLLCIDPPDPPDDVDADGAQARPQRHDARALRAAPGGAQVRRLPRADGSAGHPVRDLRRHRQVPHHRRAAAGGRHQRAEGHGQRRPGEGRHRADEAAGRAPARCAAA